MKFFLLTAGDNHYPSGTEDWIECFETYEEAMGHVKEDESYPRGGVHVNGCYYDWYEIIDLRKWIYS